MLAVPGPGSITPPREGATLCLCPPHLGCPLLPLEHPLHGQAGCRGGRSGAAPWPCPSSCQSWVVMEHLGEIIYVGKGKLFQGNFKVFQTHLIARGRMDRHGGEEKGKQPC